MEFDAVLIEQSIAKQYGILPAMQGELPWPEWAKLVSGLMDDTPLGRVVATRSETDRKVIAGMTPWQLRIRREWQNWQARRLAKETGQAEAREEMRLLEKLLAGVFGR